MFMMPPPFNSARPVHRRPGARVQVHHDRSVSFYNGNPEIEQYLLASERPAPMVGQQVTIDAGARHSRGAWTDGGAAAAGDCDLMVKGVQDGQARGWLRGDDGSFTAIAPPSADLDAELRQRRWRPARADIFLRAARLRRSCRPRPR